MKLIGEYKNTPLDSNKLNELLGNDKKTIVLAHSFGAHRAMQFNRENCSYILLDPVIVAKRCLNKIKYTIDKSKVITVRHKGSITYNEVVKKFADLLFGLKGDTIGEEEFLEFYNTAKKWRKFNNYLEYSIIRHIAISFSKSAHKELELINNHIKKMITMLHNLAVEKRTK